MNTITEIAKETVTVSLEGSLLFVKGALTVNTLSSALKQLSKIRQASDSVSFNAMSIADSSAIVFLLACLRNQSSGKLKVFDVPDRVMRLINLYDLSPMFNFSSS